MDNVWESRLNSLKRSFKYGKADLIALKETVMTSIYCFAARPKVQAIIHYLVRMS